MEDQVLKINVGGKLFSTYKSTLLSRPGTFLCQKFAHPEIFKETNDFFLDRDPLIFGIILNYYRTGILALPPKSKLRLFYNELDFYGIDHKETLPELTIEKTRHKREQSFQKPVWKKEYDLYIERFLNHFNSKISYKGEFDVPFEYIFQRWFVIHEHFWRNENIDLSLDISMSGAKSLKELIVKQKLKDETLKEPEDFEDCVDCDIYDAWIESLIFEKDDIRQILNKIKEFHEIGFNTIVQKEIVVRLIKSGWKIKIVKRKIKCGTDNKMITEFGGDDIYIDGFCRECLVHFLRNPEHFKDDEHNCDNKLEYSVLIVDL